MVYEVYRNTALGLSLQETLDQFISEGLITKDIAERILTKFDETIMEAFETRIKNRVSFKSEHLETYRFCDNVWTFVLKDVTMKDQSRTISIGKLKIVACDAKSGSADSTA